MNPIRPPSSRRRTLAVLGVLAVAVAFFLGLAQLFSLRFAAGEGYPPGSSRRSDPRGTRVLHDSLAALPDCRVDRNYESLARLVPEPAGCTLFLLGYDAELLRGPIPRSVAEELDDFARRGGRVVLALAYVRQLDVTNAWAQVRQVVQRGTPATEGAATRELTELWGFQLENGSGTGAEALHDGAIAGLPARMAWPSPRQFGSLSDAWRVVYARDGQAVVMQRPLGKGSLILLADDFVLSNEALRHRRETGLLAWLVDGSRRVIFEETHLGLTQDPGLAGLVGRYHLGGAVVGLFLLAGLYLWQQSIPFLPRRSASGALRDADVPVVGRSAAAGFRNLLRRTVPTPELPALLFQRWKDTVGRRLPPERSRVAQDLLNLENARPPTERDPLRTYREIAAELNPRSH